MTKFIRLTKTLNHKGKLIKPEQIKDLIKDDADYYFSPYYYDEDHYNTFQETGSVKGFKDVKTDRIWFDFDSKDKTLLDAKKDAVELLERLKQHKINPDNIEIYYSGNKGFNILFNLNKEITEQQVQHIACRIFGKDLPTFDTSIYNSNRLIRVPGTKHQISGLYKIPLTVNQLQNWSIDQIKEAAKNNKPLGRFEYKKFDLDDSLFEVEEVKKEVVNNPINEFDVNHKPRGWKASKWALMQGFFGPGERNQAMMILSATCKAMGYDKITSYYMCKSALQKSWERHGKGSFTKEELWSQIERIYSAEWKGGQYSEKDDAYLQGKAEELGIRELTSTTTVDIKGALKLFRGYAKNIDELTLKTGIEELDSKQRLTVGMSWGIVAAAGTGKTSITLQILHSMSKAGELCIFFSYDMYAPHVIQKIIQKHWADQDDIEIVFDRYKKNDEKYVQKVEELIIKEYPNVEFCFENGQTYDDIRHTIRDVEQRRGKKCRFIAIDYNELVMNDLSDPTQSSNQTAQKARALASTEQINVLTLFQPNKVSGDPSAEIKSYLNAKGGQTIGASVSFMLGVSRPGYDPRNPQNDKFMSLNVVKNRLGPIFYIDMKWNGYKGEISRLSPEEKRQLNDLRTKKEKESEEEEDWNMNGR